MSDRYIREPLQRIAEQVASGERPQYTVRTVLSWYQYQRRSRYALREIDSDLIYLDLGTIPHVDWTYLDGLVKFMPRQDAIKIDPLAYHEEVQAAVSTAQEPPTSKTLTFAVDAYIKTGDAPSKSGIDPTYRIGRLEMANRRPIFVPPDATIDQAITLMLKHDYSQLPVMTGERSVKGFFSWKSYGSRRSLGYAGNLVRETMDDCHRVSVNDSIFYVVKLMQDHDCVLVENETGAVTGIITPYDISVTFGQLGEPFLILGEIENHIRTLIEGKFTTEELATARDPLDEHRKVESVADLTFGEYIRLLESPDRWNKLALALDRSTFVKDLEEVRGIRNDVMHFDPEGIDDNDLKKLRDFVGFLRRIQRLKLKS